MIWCLALKACPLRNLLVRKIANQFCCRAVVTSGWPLAAGRKTSSGPRRASGWRSVINRPLAEQQAAASGSATVGPAECCPVEFPVGALHQPAGLLAVRPIEAM